MARQNLENEELGGSIRTKINDNFSELYGVSDGLGTASTANIGTGAGQVIGTDEARSYFDIAPRTSIQPTLSSNFSRNKHERYEVYGNEPKTILQQWDVARNSTATYIDANGVLQTAAPHQPRIDYSTGEGRLLVEPQTVRFNTQSTSFTGLTSGALDIEETGNTVKGLAETKLTPTTTADYHRVLVHSQSINSIPTRNSIIVKYAGCRYVSILAKADFYHAGDQYSRFDLVNGVIERTYSNTQPIIEYLGEGLYRISVLVSNAGGASNRLTIAVENNAQVSTDNAAGNGVDGVYLYHAQVEQNPLPTSPILGNGSQVTRLADIITPKGDA